ncbi:MAG: hypothetical protein PHQ22_10540 [Sulfuricurvum sp.]|nr:hypothetical protein [Sulfuricurvum sp.]
MAFSDNFNDGTITDWTITSGAWSATSFYLVGSGGIYNSIGNQQHHVSFDYYPTSSTFGNVGKLYWSGTTKGLSFTGQTTCSNVAGIGFTTAATCLQLNTQYHLSVDIVPAGNQIIFNITRSSDNVVLYLQQFPYTYTESDNFKIDESSGVHGRYDNILTSAISPGTSSFIEFDSEQYFTNDPATITWSLISSEWTDIFYFKRILLEWTVASGQDSLVLMDSPPQTGTYVYQLSDVGTYTVKLQKSFLGIGSQTDLASDTAIVQSEAQSYILPESPTGFMRVPFNVSYNIGYSLTGYTSEIEIIGTNTVTGGIIEVSIIDASLGNTGTQILQQTDVKVWPEGKYSLKLYDARKDRVLDTKYITIVNDPRLIPVLLFNTSNISTDRLSYFINDYMTVDFVVDDANFTAYTIRADVYNYNSLTTTKQFFTAFTGQVGSFETLVNSKIDMRCDRGIYCWFDSGINQIRLTAYNDTYSNTIASYNFTVAATTVDGWGLSLSSQNISTTEELTMKVIIPVGATGKLQIRDPGYGTNTTKVYVVENINEGTQTYKTTVKRVGLNGKGFYEVEIIDQSNHVVKMHLPLKVTFVSEVAPIPPGMGAETGTDISGLLQSKIFWTLVFIVGIMLAISMKERKP